MNDNNYSKLDLALKYYLTGAKYTIALKAYHFAKRYHCCTRKDGKTPEFQHQLEIALFITTLKDVENEEEALFYAIMHDVLEDFNTVTVDMLTDEFPSNWVIKLKLISKKIECVKTYNSLYEYFDKIATEPLVALAKGVDRIHNLQSMSGVFTSEKQRDYISETNTFFLPMLKAAVEHDPSLFSAIMNVRTVLKCQVELLEVALVANEVI
jgi:(p)ppGpp synthase/HD superfamily hydrolase